MLSLYIEMPLRATLTRAPSPGSSTSTHRARRASSSMNACDAGEPISSSDVTTNVTPARSVSPLIANSACASPAFMSNAPGPVARPSVTVKGHRAIVPAGQTVSKWQSTSTPPSRPRTRSSGRPLTSSDSGTMPMISSMTCAATRMPVAIRPASSLGVSAVTRRSSTATMSACVASAISGLPGRSCA